jgi:hypothetical protein
MRRHIITSIFLALICNQKAQGNQAPPPKSRGQSAAAIKVYPAGGKRIRIVAGARRTLVDLTDNISGCLELIDPHTPKWRSKRPLGIKVIDKVRKDDKYYLVLLTSAQSNCNVQGRCGAATDYTLIWLKLGRSDITMVDPGGVGQDETMIKLVGDKLTVEYGNTFDDNVRTLSRLVYDRGSPEQGFVITDREKKSQ